MQNKQSRIIIVLLPLIIAVSVGAGMLIGTKLGTNAPMSAAHAKLNTVLGLIDQDYVDKVDIDSLLDATIPDLLAQLDPHSVYIPKSELQAANDDLEASFSGVGISFQISNDSVVVVEVISGGPAEKVGLQNGDRIVEANGTKLTGKDVTSDDVFKTLRGPKDTKVTLIVARSNSAKLLTYDVVRGDIPQASVDSRYIISDGIGYIRVGKFARNTYQEFLDALKELQSQGAKKYVIDLRNNSGGFMDQAVLMANEFLPQDRLIVMVKGRDQRNNEAIGSDGSGAFQNAEIAVITNEYSASASEIFAGAIQDNDRGIVIGRRTFGKGLVQNQISLPDSSAIRLTVARYYTPSGRSIQKEYTKGESGKYELDIIDRYKHGEFYNVDSIKVDKSKLFHTIGGRSVYGGGGIIPDVFVAEDTVGINSYYTAVANDGLLQKFSFDTADRYRNLFKGIKEPDVLLGVLPADDTLIQNFADFAAGKGHPQRWNYINESRDLLLNQIKSLVVRDVLGFSGMIRILNQNDKTVQEAVDILRSGKSPTVIPNAENRKQK